MAFGVDLLEALAECVELINSGRRISGGTAGPGGPGGGAGPGGGPTAAGPGGRAAAGEAGEAGENHEQLTSLDDLVAFGRRHRVENLGAASASDVPRLRELRDRLDAVAAACERGASAAAIDGLNALLAETGAVPQIVSHDDRPPHVHVTRASAPLADRIAAHCAMGLAELVVAGAGRRVRTCASPRCDAVFVDLSRNQTRRFCDSRTCGNRAHVAAYRSRHSARAAL
jgi:predicted RNA-binding Zn ribbon-like protein